MGLEIRGEPLTFEKALDRRIEALDYCPGCGHHNCNCDVEIEDESAYMGSDSDFSDHALGIDY